MNITQAALADHIEGEAATPLGPQTTSAIAVEAEHTAHNYAPLPVVLSHGEGAWVTDVDGRHYVDLLAGYSALNFGHRHPRIVAAAHRQLDRVTLTSRAFHNDQLGAFARDLAKLADLDLVLPMNTGAEAVETAIKAARKWAYTVKGVPADMATIIVANGNFHGRTTTIVGFSDDAESRNGFGPFAPGFRRAPYGDSLALAAAIDSTTAAVLIEPVQGEAGVIVPPAGYLKEVRRLCTQHNVLMIADEIQSGLGRTGATFACDHEQVRPDAYLLGKALGGGVVPLSAVVARREVLDVFGPGEHGSTFGGNPLACAVGLEVLSMLSTGQFQARARQLGLVLAARLHELPAHAVSAVRVCGLWAGIDVVGRSGRSVCEGLQARGVLAKETHANTLRLAPPLVISEADLNWALDQLAAELS